MRNVPHPSREVLQQAFVLGQQLARTERRLIPRLSGAHEYASYAQFITTHRHRLEQSKVYEEWDVKLHEVVAEEGRRCGLNVDSPGAWEILFTYIATPVRCSFWYGWESVFNLQKLYKQEVELARRSRAGDGVLRICNPLPEPNPPQSPLIPCSPLPDKFADDEQWDSMTIQMMDQLNTPEARESWNWVDSDITEQVD